MVRDGPGKHPYLNFAQIPIAVLVEGLEGLLHSILFLVGERLWWGLTCLIFVRRCRCTTTLQHDRARRIKEKVNRGQQRQPAAGTAPYRRQFRNLAGTTFYNYGSKGILSELIPTLHLPQHLPPQTHH